MILVSVLVQQVIEPIGPKFVVCGGILCMCGVWAGRWGWGVRSQCGGWGLVAGPIGKWGLNIVRIC